MTNRFNNDTATETSLRQSADPRTARQREVDVCVQELLTHLMRTYAESHHRSILGFAMYLGKGIGRFRDDAEDRPKVWPAQLEGFRMFTSPGEPASDCQTLTGYMSMLATVCGPNSVWTGVLEGAKQYLGELYYGLEPIAETGFGWYPSGVQTAARDGGEPTDLQLALNLGRYASAVAHAAGENSPLSQIAQCQLESARLFQRRFAPESLGEFQLALSDERLPAGSSNLTLFAYLYIASADAARLAKDERLAERARASLIELEQLSDGLRDWQPRVETSRAQWAVSEALKATRLGHVL